MLVQSKIKCLLSFFWFWGVMWLHEILLRCACWWLNWACVFWTCTSSNVFSFLYVCAPQIGDRSGELTARMNVSDLQLVLGLKQNNTNTNSSAFIESPSGDSSPPGNSTHYFPQTLKPSIPLKYIIKLFFKSIFMIHTWYH